MTAHAYLTSAIDAAGNAQVGGEVELTGGDLALVATERVDATSIAHIPDLHGIVETTRNDALALSVEVQRDDLGVMTQQRMQALTCLYVPQSRRVVHRPRGQHRAVWIKRQTDDLGGVASVRVVQLPGFGVPQLACFVCTNQDYKQSNIIITIITMVIPKEPVMILSPKGLLKAMAYTTLRWPSSVNSSSPVIVFHTLQVRS